MAFDPSAISAIAVDLVDTLVRRGDSVFSERAAAYLSRKGLKVTAAEFLPIFRHRYLEYSMGNYETDGEFFRVLLAQVLNADIEPATQHLRDLLLSSMQPFPDSSDFLRSASRRYKVVLSSNQVGRWAREIVVRNEWPIYFTDMVISSECGFRKPARGFFDRLLAVCDADSPDRILMVGDSLTDDIFGAKSCGLRAVRLDRRTHRVYHTSEGLTSVSSLRDLAKFLVAT